MRRFRFFAWNAAGLAALLAVLGSWVRINGAGMTCPDWPLCNGRLVPTLSGGVVLEWSHRLVASVEGLLLIGLIATGWGLRGRLPGIRRGLALLAGVFALQVGLGGLTVHLDNSPASVVIHWGTAMILIGVLAALALLGSGRRAPADPGFAAIAAAATAVFATMCAGAFVSSSGAGLACAAFPGCGSTWFGDSPAQFAQMIHRSAALAVGIATIGAVIATGASSRRTRTLVLAGAALVALQIALGIANVALAMPMALREAHAANAVATFLAFALASVTARLDGIGARTPVPNAAARVHGHPQSATS